MRVINRNIKIGSEPILVGVESGLASIEKIEEAEGVSVYRFAVIDIANIKPISVMWRMPATNIRGAWSSNLLLDKRIRADWEVTQLTSSISVDAPLMCLYGHDDSNRITFAVSDTISTIDFESSLREEDNYVYCVITFFTESYNTSESYSADIRIDYRDVTFSQSIQEASIWLESVNPMPPTHTPEYAKVPLYSTWYSYHQNINEKGLLAECRASKKMGYDMIIVDDGWQTLDGNRGYDYTGDWEPDRMPEMAKFVQDVHDVGMKIMLWYSVPFCGVKSKAYQRFKGKFLTENHHWAPVFDPRFPEVRAYLISRYVSAMKDWNIDGFKLDFIDDFKIYPETNTSSLDGRDVLSVNKGVELLIREIKIALSSINPDVLIEFRQKYISPALRHLGNMFRAFDCPNDSLMNRVRTTDVKLLCGDTAVHSDMITWHADEPVEIAALQLTSILFTVPQLSVKLGDTTDEYKFMISFYTHYWKDNRDILLDGSFVAYNPMANYPCLRAVHNDKAIYGIYEQMINVVDGTYKFIDVVNGKLSDYVVVDMEGEISNWKIKVYDCKGNLVNDQILEAVLGLQRIEVPSNGLIQMEKI